MTSRRPSDETLQAYYDGELGFFARRRVARQVAASPEAQAELRGLALVGELVRESEAATVGPDLWAEIARELPRRPVEAGPEAGRAGLSDALGWLLRPFPAAAAAAVAAAVVTAIFLLSGQEPSTGVDVVQYLDPGENSVMLLQGEDDATIIWVMEPPAPAPTTDTSTPSKETRAFI